MKVALTLLLGLLASAMPATAATPATAAQRAQFLAAEDALSTDDGKRYRQLHAALADYPLRPYLDYKRSVRELGALTPAQARGTLRALAATPLVERFRAQWLKELARRRQWGELVAFYKPTSNVEVRCQHARALLVLGKRKAAIDAARPLWRHGSSRPKACDPVFKSLLTAGQITADDIWERFGLAVRKGNVRLARYLKKRLPAARQAHAARWLSLRARPARVADLRPDADLPDLTLTRYAMRRLALADGAAAAELWSTLRQRPDYPAATRTEIDGYVGLGLALDHDARAFEWMSHLPENVPASLREWRVRSAIRAGNWSGVSAAISKLTDAQRKTLRWRYWQARADIELGRRNVGEKQLARLATARDYHAFLAADRLGLPYALNHEPTVSRRAVSAAVASAPAMLRIRELLALDRVTTARSEWYAWLEDSSAEQIAAAAALVSEWGWSTATITGLARIRQFGDLHLRFPVMYRAQIERNAAALALPPSWILAVVRQESAFARDARSPVGARGLMQIMPATGKQLARQLGKRLPRADALLNPSLNLHFGANYLAQLKQQFGGQIALATAAYNAGPHRVQGWLPERPLDADQWVETIPFKETRRYVQRVLEYKILYRARLGVPLGRLSDALPSVQPEDAEVSDRL